MRALLVSDIHGNLHALQAVLDAARGPQVGGFDELWNLGDMVGYGARPNDVLELLRSTPAEKKVHVRGNHDRVCCGLTSSQGFNPVAAEAAAWTQRHLTVANLEWLRALPQGPIRASERAVCAHGSPLHEDHYIVSMRDAWTPLQRMETELAFFGHTHVQGGFSQSREQWEEVRPVYANAGEFHPSPKSWGPPFGGLQLGDPEPFLLEVPLGTRHLINPGSVGQPRDNDWRAAFAIYESDGDTAVEQVTFFRVPYDVEAAQAAIRAAHLPERLAARLSGGR
jgi:diadenosine tetraphosphatase ApaH/serine/threonine PP2A family protein phosphatase